MQMMDHDELIASLVTTRDESDQGSVEQLRDLETAGRKRRAAVPDDSKKISECGNESRAVGINIPSRKAKISSEPFRSVCSLNTQM